MSSFSLPDYTPAYQNAGDLGGQSTTAPITTSNADLLASLDPSMVNSQLSSLGYKGSVTDQSTQGSGASLDPAFQQWLTNSGYSLTGGNINGAGGGRPYGVSITGAGGNDVGNMQGQYADTSVLQALSPVLMALGANYMIPNAATTSALTSAGFPEIPAAAASPFAGGSTVAGTGLSAADLALPSGISTVAPDLGASEALAGTAGAAGGSALSSSGGNTVAGSGLSAADLELPAGISTVAPDLGGASALSAGAAIGGAGGSGATTYPVSMSPGSAPLSGATVDPNVLPNPAQSAQAAGAQQTGSAAGVAPVGGSAPPIAPGAGGTNLFDAQAAGVAPVPPSYSAGPGGGAASTPSYLDKALSAISGNPIGAASVGLGAASLGEQLHALSAQKQLQSAAAPAQALENSLMQQYQAGTLNPAQQAQVAQWSDQQKAQTQAYYAKAGLSNSSMEQDAMAQIDSKAQMMRQQILDSMLTSGVQAAGVANPLLTAGVTAGINQDQAAMTSMQNFLNQLAKMNTPQPSTTTPTDTTTTTGSPG